MTGEDIQERKKQLRNEIISRVKAIPPAVKKAKDKMIRENLLNTKFYNEAKTVMLYASFRDEIDTQPVIEDAIMKDKKVVLPRVNAEKKELELYSIDAVGGLRPGYMNIPEPQAIASRRVAAEDIEFIVVPGLAFDSEGGRLGYGGGYYDRLLGTIPSKPTLIALSYEEQLVVSVPVTENDQKVDMIITDDRIITIH